MAKFNVNTAKLVRDLELRVNELKAKKDSYWLDKTNYEKLKQEIVEKAVYKIYERNVTSYSLYADKITIVADVLLVDLNITEPPPYPKEVSDYEIKQAEKLLNLYKMCTDETISVSDTELQTIMGL